MYSTQTTITQEDLDRIHSESLLDLHSVQQATGGQGSDLALACLFSTTEGLGMGMYEGRIIYQGRSFPGFGGDFWDWYRDDHSGSSMFKIGDSDKVFRRIWTTSIPYQHRHWLRFWKGNWLLAWLSDFLVSNTFATWVRSYAKYGDFRVDVSIDWPFK